MFLCFLQEILKASEIDNHLNQLAIRIEDNFNVVATPSRAASRAFSPPPTCQGVLDELLNQDETATVCLPRDAASTVTRDVFNAMTRDGAIPSREGSRAATAALDAGSLSRVGSRATSRLLNRREQMHKLNLVDAHRIPSSANMMAPMRPTTARPGKAGTRPSTRGPLYRGEPRQRLSDVEARILAETGPMVNVRPTTGGLRQHRVKKSLRQIEKVGEMKSNSLHTLNAYIRHCNPLIMPPTC